jgi:hypothetical protein
VLLAILIAELDIIVLTMIQDSGVDLGCLENLHPVRLEDVDTSVVQQYRDKFKVRIIYYRRV